jgi:hypothetical protein
LTSLTNSPRQYGCNLSFSQMSTRAPSAIPVSLAILHHHRWVISARGLANIVPSPDHVVYGVVYSVPTSQIAALDDAEGVSRGLYQHLDIDVVMIYKDLNSTECKQLPIPCWTYIDRQSSTGFPMQSTLNVSMRAFKTRSSLMHGWRKIFAFLFRRLHEHLFKYSLLPLRRNSRPFDSSLRRQSVHFRSTFAHPASTTQQRS